MIAIIYLAFTIVLCIKYERRIKELEERILSLEQTIKLNEVLENEVDD